MIEMNDLEAKLATMGVSDEGGHGLSTSGSAVSDDDNDLGCCLPPEMWEKILLDAAVLEALDVRRLKTVVEKLGAVCRLWYSIVTNDLFIRRVKLTLWKQDPALQYFDTPELVQIEGMNILAKRPLLYYVTMLGADIFGIAHNKRNIEVWDTSNYNSDEQSIEFRLSRQMSINLDPHLHLEFMDASESGQKLVLVSHEEGSDVAIISCVDPMTGRSDESSWPVSDDYTSVKVVSATLYVGFKDRLEVRDLSTGLILHTMSVDLSDSRTRVMEMQESKGHYVITTESVSIVDSCCGVMKRRRWRHALNVRGAYVDRHGHVMVLSGDGTNSDAATVRIVRRSLLGNVARVIKLTDPNYQPIKVSTGRFTSENWYIWLDYARGLLFVWSMFRRLCVYRVLDIVSTPYKSTSKFRMDS